MKPKKENSSENILVGDSNTENELLSNGEILESCYRVKESCSRFTESCYNQLQILIEKLENLEKNNKSLENEIIAQKESLNKIKIELSTVIESTYL